MFGPPEPADRLCFNVAQNEWRRERATVQMGLAVEDAGNTHGVMYMKDEALAASLGDRHQLFVAKQKLGGHTNAEDDEQTFSCVKLMAIARWYADHYNASVCRVPGSTPVKFLQVWGYVLVCRRQVPVLQVETFAAEYEKFTYDNIPLSVEVHGEIEAAFLFALFTFEQSGGEILLCDPTRVARGIWGPPVIASTAKVGECLDLGRAFMLQYMMSESHATMQMKKDVDGSRDLRQIFLRSLRLCLVQSKSADQLHLRLNQLMGDANRVHMGHLIHSLTPRDSVLSLQRDSIDRRRVFEKAPSAPLRPHVSSGVPHVCRNEGAERNPYASAAGQESLYGGQLYEIGHARTVWVAPDFSKPAPPPSPTRFPTPPPTPPPPPPPPTPPPVPPDPHAGKTAQELVAEGIIDYDPQTWESRLRRLRGEKEDDPEIPLQGRTCCTEAADMLHTCVYVK